MSKNKQAASVAANHARNSALLVKYAKAADAAAPAAPAWVAPTPNADDMLTVNNWLTSFNTQLEDIDFGIAQLETDTKYQKGQNDRRAVENRSASDDAMAARGIFTSSLRDAAVMDIEATRSLANTYLDSKLQDAVTQGATRKNTLAQSKTAFETSMAAKYGENAAAINATLNDGYASAMAAYKPPTSQTFAQIANETPKAKPTVTKTSPAPKPAAPPKVVSSSAQASTTASAAQALAATKAKKPKKSP